MRSDPPDMLSLFIAPSRVTVGVRVRCLSCSSLRPCAWAWAWLCMVVVMVVDVAVVMGMVVVIAGAVLVDMVRVMDIATVTVIAMIMIIVMVMVTVMVKVRAKIRPGTMVITAYIVGGGYMICMWPGTMVISLSERSSI